VNRFEAIADDFAHTQHELFGPGGLGGRRGPQFRTLAFVRSALCGGLHRGLRSGLTSRHGFDFAIEIFRLNRDQIREGAIKVAGCDDVHPDLMLVEAVVTTDRSFSAVNRLDCLGDADTD
jgi:hypothetical protein